MSLLATIFTLVKSQPNLTPVSSINFLASFERTAKSPESNLTPNGSKPAFLRQCATKRKFFTPEPIVL